MKTGSRHCPLEESAEGGKKNRKLLEIGNKGSEVG